MYTWEDMVTQWAGCWDIEKNRVKDKEKYRLFRNTKQGLTFEDFGVQITHERAIQYRRTGFITGTVPNDLAVEDTGTPILILVASVDVQNDRLYYDIKGYSGSGSAWKLDFGKPNHAFDTYVYNLAALEIYAEDFCKSPDGLGLAALDWDAFWAAARTGVFYGEAG